MKIFMFHLMPWAYLPASYEGPAWVKCPNSHYDARRGHDLYNRYIDELMRAEALGFDGVCVNEHHANAYGNMPSPNLIAAILARQTSHMRTAVVGNGLPLYNPPIREPGGGDRRHLGFRGRAGLGSHGMPLFPQAAFQKDLRLLPRGGREGGLHRRSRADGLARAGVRGGERRAGTRGVRGAPLVL